MSKRPELHDPFAAREAEKYDNPIPSREWIMKLMEEQGVPLSFASLSQLLQLQDEQSLEALDRRLRAMVRDGQLLRGRRGLFCLVSHTDLSRGTVQVGREGFAQVICESGAERWVLVSRDMARIYHGDEVLVQPLGLDRRGRQEVRIVEILARNTRELVGRVQRHPGFAIVVPENTRLHHDVLVSDEHLAGARDNELVVVELTQQPERHQQPMGQVIEVLGEHMAPGMEVEVALRSYGIPHTFPDIVLEEAGQIALEPEEEDCIGRVDLRHLPLVTIDGEDARDFDDAVFCEAKRGGGWRLWVAIADVSHYVGVSTALDEEACERSTSVYFPGRVVPMLPEALSNGVCSLNPHVDRLCMVAELTISEQGRLSGYRFSEAVMHSKARLTYTKVAAMLAPDNPRGDELREQYREVLPHLQELERLYHALRQERERRGAIDFDSVETRIVFNKMRKIDYIEPVMRNDAHRLIEECMLCANVAAARFLEKHQLPGLYRVHEGPKPQRLEVLRDYIGMLGLELRGGDSPTPDDYQRLMVQIAERPDAQVIQTLMLRSLSQAVYQPDNQGHFGLNYPAYTHFTSPIRRYPDLLIHRAIRWVIRSGMESRHVRRADETPKMLRARIYPYGFERLVQLGMHCSARERRADEAVRDVVSWLKCEYLSEHVGDRFTGVVNGVTHFGLFVELDDLYVEGMVHISSLASDYYRFDEARQALVGERSGQRFSLGDRVSVQVAGVSLEEKKIDLELISVGARAARGARADSGKPRRRGPAKGPYAPEREEKSARHGADGKKKHDKKRKHKKHKKG